MGNYTIEEGTYGQRLIVQGPWSEEIESVVKHLGIVELYLNYALGFRGRDLSFLANLTHLQWLWLIHRTIENVQPIHNLHELRTLKVYTYCRSEIDFSQFPRLEECFLDWRPRAASLFDCKSLRKLWLNDYPGKNLSQFMRLSQLWSLGLANGGVADIKDVGQLAGLTELELHNLKKLQTLEGVEGLKRLQSLVISGCTNIRTIDPVGKLANLKRLQLTDCAHIESLKPLSALHQLEELLFYDNTNILDGDLSPVANLKNLRKVAFADRVHYSHKMEEMLS